MIIMVLDHVRDYFHGSPLNPTDLSQATPELFLTRWITHFCAPVFVFLAGISAFLYGQKVQSTRALKRFLLTRGLWLVLVEVTLITFGWQFDVSFNTLIFQVIWAIGVSMILLSFMITWPVHFLLTFSLLLIIGHNTMDAIQVEGNSLGAIIGAFLHQFHFVQLGPVNLLILYPIIPWVAVMMLGYCTGQLYAKGFEAASRKKVLVVAGVVAMLCFVLLRASNLYGDPTPWAVYDSGLYTVLSFINTHKYPPSLLYLLMTLGPALLFLGLTENKKISQFQPVVTIGKVPFFFYVVHIYLVHSLQMLTMIVLPDFTYHDAVESLLAGRGAFGYALPVVYLIWIAVVLLLYLLSDWFNKVKNRHKDKWWVSYV